MGRGVDTGDEKAKMFSEKSDQKTERRFEC